MQATKAEDDQPVRYEITVLGQISPDWSAWFGDMDIGYQTLADGTVATCLCGLVADQAALHGILDRIHDLNLILLSVARR